MPDAELRPADDALSSGTAVLISEGPADAIAEKLHAHGLQAQTSADLDGVAQLDASGDPTVVVLEIPGPTSSLARIVGSVAKRFDGVPVIVVCGDIERWAIRTALAGGAAGVVLHEQLDAAFGPCLRAVLAGQACVPRAYRQQIEPPPLSAREKQILGLVVMGYMNGQIAEQLFLAESTVKSHLSSAFSKLGVRSRNEAVRLIVDPDNGFGLGILGLGGEPLGSDADF
jgi:DNA-binding NarL/FixJ family response regulator